MNSNNERKSRQQTAAFLARGNGRGNNAARRAIALGFGFPTPRRFADRALNSAGLMAAGPLADLP